MSLRLGVRLEADAAPFLESLAAAEAGLGHFEASATAVADRVADEVTRRAGDPAPLQSLVVLEQAGARAAPALQAVTDAGDHTVRTLVVLAENAGGGGRALDRWSAAALQVGDAAGTVGRSVDTASGAFAGMAEDAGDVAAALGQLPMLFKLFIAALTVDIALRVFSALREEVVALGQALTAETVRLHDYIDAQEGLVGVAARAAEHLAVSRGVVLTLSRLGVAAEVANPVGWAVGAAMTLGSLAEHAGKAMDAADAAAAAHARLDRELERTHHAAGLAAEEIEALAQALARTTRFDSTGLTEAAQGLLRFRTLSAEVFGDALRLAADLAAKTGRDLPDAVTLLGRALDAPTAGFNDLAEAGVHVSHAIREQIADLETLGRHTEAQRALMAAVAENTRGAASAMDDNARASHRLEESWDRLGVAVGRRLNEVRDWLTAPLFDFSGITRAIDDLVAEANEGWARLLEPEPVERRIVAVNRALIDAQRTLAEAERDASGSWLGTRWLDPARREVSALQAELDRLLAQARQEAAAHDATVDGGRRDQEALRHAERLAEVRRELDAETVRLFPPDENERIAAINADLERTLRLLDGLRDRDGGNAAAVEAVAAGAARVADARRQAVLDEGQTVRERELRAAVEAEGALIDRRRAGVAAIEEQIAALGQERARLGETSRERAVHDALLRAEETARRAGITLTDEQRAALEREAGALADERAARDANRTATERTTDANRALIDSLSAEIASLGLSARERAVEQALRRLSADATAEQRDRVRELAGALFDEKQAAEANTRTAETLKRLRRELADIDLSEGDRAAAQAVRQLGENASAADKAVAALLARQIQDGREAARMIDSVRDGAARYSQEMERLNRLLQAGAIDQETWGRAAEAAQKRALEASTRWQDGAIRGLQDYAAEAGNAARQVERLMTSAFGRLEDTLTKFVTRQKVDIGDLLDGIAQDFARLMIRTTITGPLASAAASGLGSLFGGLFHEGGTAGDTGIGRDLPAGLFRTAPRLHTGSVPWLAPDEVPAILQRGEIVLSRAQAGAIAAGGDAAPAAPVYVIQVDARGAEDADAVAARVEEAVDRALAVRLPGVVRAAAGVARAQVADDWTRRGGRLR